MAKVVQITSKNPRRKKFEHFKLKLRIYLFRISVLTNLACLIYLLHQDGHLTNIIESYNSKVAPILESLINKLPL